MPPDKPPDIGNWIASCVAMWSNTLARDECVSLIVSEFDPEDIREASIVINEYEALLAVKDVKKIIVHREGISKVLGERLFEKVYELKNKDVTFYVPCDELSRFKGIRKAGAEAEGPAAISSRMNMLETKQDAMMAMIREIKDQRQNPVVTVSGPATSFADMVGSGGARPKTGAPGGAPGGAHGGAGGALAPPPPRLPRNGRSQSQNSQESRDSSVNKRRRTDVEEEEKNDGYQRVDRQKKNRKSKVTQGSSKVELANANVALRPCDFFIGNTGAECDSDTIKEVLIEVARRMPDTDEHKLDSDLEILEVELLTKHKDPRSKNWRVRVPQKYRDHMYRAEAIPSGWNSRKYYFPRAPKKDSPDENKAANEAQLNIVKAATEQSLPPGAHYVPQ